MTRTARSRFGAATIVLLLAVGCGRLPGCGESARPVAYLQHWVIDPHPSTGKECCTDVLALGDIDGDGRQDIVLGAQESPAKGLVWYQYPTWERHGVARGEFTTDGQTADVDGDGDTDIVVGTYPEGKGEILWFENVDGRGRSWSQHAVGTAYAHDIAVGDVDGDGDLDVVTCDKHRLVLWLQGPQRTFEERLLQERPGEGTALADIDRDGDLDVVFGGSWLENRGASATDAWPVHAIASDWPADTRVVVADMNDDTRADVVLSVSEGEGRVAWFEAPLDPKTRGWKMHAVETRELEGAHSLAVADVDGDGKKDVIVAEMHTSWWKRVMVYRSEGTGFTPIVLSRRGSHDMRVADLDGDGDVDLVGKNYGGEGRVLEMWENLSSKTGTWAHIAIDQDRPKDQQGKMGLVFTDVDGDGFRDVIAGALWYRNPGRDIQRPWARAPVGDPGMDVFFAIDVDHDDKCDLVGIKDDDLYWIEAADVPASSWAAHAVGKLPEPGRTQGYVVVEASGGTELVFDRGTNVYAVRIPAAAAKGGWSVRRVSTELDEGDLAVGDLDRDGDVDIAGVRVEAHQVVWLENPGSWDTSPWTMHVVGDAVPDERSWIDRIRIADLNDDGHLDIVATEERRDWKQRAHLYWFEAPGELATGSWRRHVIARARSLNSMDVADVDGDGAVDISVAEHTDQREDVAKDNLTMIYLNKHHASAWLPVVVARGPYSSHLGARLVDLDGDKHFEIASFGWNQYQYVNAWKGLPK